MGTVFLGVGHGVRPDGTYDPGAVNPNDGAVEHLSAYQVVYHATLNLRARGFKVVSESDLPVTKDPDYVGSAAAANAAEVRAAVEVHFDWFRGTVGQSSLFISDAGAKLGWYVRNGFSDHELPVASPVHRPNLYFLKHTNMPAILCEVDRIHRMSEHDLASRGFALANGVQAYLKNAPRP